MRISYHKLIIGTAISLIAIAVAIPVAYWYIILALDDAVGWQNAISGVPALIASAASFAIGLFWVFWAWSYLVFLGEGLPAELFGVALHPTQNLVTAGPYAYCRNPMIIGLLFILAGVALLQGSIFGLILLPVVAAAIAVYLVLFEEKGLEKRFGEDYDHYRRNVPLLIPSVSPYIPGTTKDA